MADVVEKRSVVEPLPIPLAQRGGPHSGRFALVLLLVMVIFALMLAFFGYLIAKSDTSSAPWSSYEPPATGEPLTRAQSLANYVGPRYLSNGDPLAVVQAQPLIFKQADVSGLAFMRQPNQGVGTAFTQYEPADDILMYVFCGPASGCALPARGDDVTALIERESLELALYTFKYWPDIKSVVILLPPTRNQKPAFLFRRAKLEDRLSRPLAATLPKRDVITVQSMTDAELATVKALTEENIFLSSFETTPNGATILLLGSDR